MVSKNVDLYRKPYYLKKLIFSWKNHIINNFCKKIIHACII